MPADMKEHADISEHMSDIEDDTENGQHDETMADAETTGGQAEVKKKYDPKDPSRPRRKKARRACFACQRAHLTCGDERPCKRCVKRGLADQCQDGVRKKAKYLHDAPAEALRPVLGPSFDPNNPPRTNGRSNSQSDTMSNPAGNNFIQPPGGAYPMYPGAPQNQVSLPENMSFNPQASPVTQGFPGPSAAGQTQMNSMVGANNNMDFNALFDPSNPALYNFDLEGLNFGSQYAGWEFGILNKMALGADTPSRENSISQATDSSYTMFGNGNGNNNGYDTSNMMAGGMDANSNMYKQGNLQHGLPHAYAIAAAPTSLASPSTESTTSPKPTNNNKEEQPAVGGFPSLSALSGESKMKGRPDKIAQILGKRQRDSAAIYSSVQEPYPYTAGFHNMISVLRDRLPLNKLLKIARYLGEIRPSFIACTKDLTKEDLVFMEKCFQRTLVEFNDFLQHCCAPTIVCRRSGEVAAVNKEFTALTGWTKDVLLGKEPNQNVYSRPLSADGADDGESGSRTGTSTPRSKASAAAGKGANDGKQPVFLAELLDDDSVVDFYHDFAQLAFEDSRGKVQRSCRLMKYRTEDADSKEPNRSREGILSNRVTRIDGEHGISRIEKDGKVDCTYCWTIKRDVFDIPMMIIINFLPRYYPNQEPHQLAV